MNFCPTNRSHLCHPPSVTLQFLLMPQQFDDVGDCVDATLRRVGKRIVLALPLALGNPVPLVNEFYRRALRDRSTKLKIFTGLSLRKPQASGELERRFLDPFVAGARIRRSGLFGVADCVSSGLVLRWRGGWGPNTPSYLI